MAGSRAINVYLDSSVVLRHLFRQPGRMTETSWMKAYSSRLLQTECCRVIDRARLQQSISDRERAMLHEELISLCERIIRVPLSEEVLYRAELALPTALGTLDAIHLATAMLIQEKEKTELTILTHDRQLGLAARSVGFDVEGTEL
jgi:predicted nucleic acid-binding protein